MRTVFSDFAVGGLISQGVDEVGERGALFEARRPAADHELVNFGGASIRSRKLQLSHLQTCNKNMRHMMTGYKKFPLYLTQKTLKEKKRMISTFQNLVVVQFAVWHFTQTENLPHQHSEGPHVRLGGVIVLEHRFCWQPAQRDPGLSVVVVLTEYVFTGQRTYRNRGKPQLM